MQGNVVLLTKLHNWKHDIMLEESRKILPKFLKLMSF